MSSSKALSEATAGYDNTDAAGGEADLEVYLYEAGGGLTCVSCNPSGARPEGQRLHLPYLPQSQSVSSWAPPQNTRLEPPASASHVLSDDGERVFSSTPTTPSSPRTPTGKATISSGRRKARNLPRSQQAYISLVSTGQSREASNSSIRGADGPRHLLLHQATSSPATPAPRTSTTRARQQLPPLPPEAPPCVGTPASPRPGRRASPPRRAPASAARATRLLERHVRAVGAGTITSRAKHRRAKRREGEDLSARQAGPGDADRGAHADHDFHRHARRKPR